eukprot:m.132333 g.132333  ORF g.132333 m.132333 type:complete len:431 (+) comp17494_c0_seq1:378-1670(+)
MMDSGGSNTCTQCDVLNKRVNEYKIDIAALRDQLDNIINENGEICAAYLDEIDELQNLVKDNELLPNESDLVQTEERYSKLLAALHDQKNEIEAHRMKEKTLLSEIERLKSLQTAAAAMIVNPSVNLEDGHLNAVQSDDTPPILECEQIKNKQEQIHDLPKSVATASSLERLKNISTNNERNSLLESQLQETSLKLIAKEKAYADVIMGLSGIVNSLNSGTNDLVLLDRLPQQQELCGVVAAIRKLIIHRMTANEHGKSAAKSMLDLASARQDRSMVNKKLARSLDRLAAADAEMKKLVAENKEMRRQMEDLPTLHRSLADARTALADAEAALQQRSTTHCLPGAEAGGEAAPAKITAPYASGRSSGLRRRLQHVDISDHDEIASGGPSKRTRQYTPGYPAPSGLTIVVGIAVTMAAWWLCWQYCIRGPP